MSRVVRITDELYETVALKAKAEGKIITWVISDLLEKSLPKPSKKLLERTRILIKG